jgi:tetraacyldisaccharide 4'-kinase
MSDWDKKSIQKILDGTDRSAMASIVLGAAACAEPFFSAAARFRNSLYNRGVLRSHSLGKPTISVGNITVGGTGKTPVVRWLAEKLRASGAHPAILLRGYKPTPQGLSDEADLLRLLLGPSVRVVADPNRIRGAVKALDANPHTTMFILDDGMQHRRAKRDFELVLIHARQPFGFGHVLPRGLLRESLTGLKRANAILLTHASEVDVQELARIETIVRQHNLGAPIFRADHVINGFRAAANDVLFLPQYIFGKRYFAFCGIGSPGSFFASLEKLGGICAGTKSFPDHHPYTGRDMAEIELIAKQSGADMLVTTEKDWVKLPQEPNEENLKPILVRAELSLQFWDDHEQRLLEAIGKSIVISPVS